MRPIRGEIVKALISGGTVELDTPIGAKLPLNFAADGMVTGNSVVLAFYLGSTKDRGRWWISGNTLCTKFFRWFDAKQRCLSIRPDGAKFAWTMDDGDTGTATIVSNTKRLYGAGSALTGGISAAHMVRNAEERLAAAEAKPAADQVDSVQVASLSVPPQTVKPKIKPNLQPDAATSETAVTTEVPARPQAPVVDAPAVEAPVPAMAAANATGDPRAWLPMSATKLEIHAVVTTPVAPAAVMKTNTRTASAEAVPSTFRAREPVEKVAQAGPAQTYKVAGVTEDDVLNVRLGPQMAAAVIGAIPRDARGVVVSGQCLAEWCPVTYQKQYGWVSQLFLEAE